VIVEAVPAALAGERLDRIVAVLLDVSRSVAVTVIEAGGVSVDGVTANSGKTRLDEGQEVAADPAAIPVEQPPSADDTV
jgi:23S rRNA pseudouridine1911/1915/1917 synthase